MLWYRKRACTFWGKELQGCYLVSFCPHCRALCTSLRFLSTGHIWGHLGLENVALSAGPGLICKFVLLTSLSTDTWHIKLLIVIWDCSKLARILYRNHFVLTVLTTCLSFDKVFVFACFFAVLICCQIFVVAVACCGLLWNLYSVYGYQELWRIWGNHFVIQWQKFLRVWLTSTSLNSADFWICWDSRIVCQLMWILVMNEKRGFFSFE